MPEVRNQAEATCAGDGYTGDTYCTVCGEVLQIGERIPATDHVWDGAGGVRKGHGAVYRNV